MKTIAYVLTWCVGMCVHAASFRGLGDLPGGPFFSAARDISADGQVVVGTSQSTNGYEAFRWTAANGMQGLGDLPGGTFTSEASAISANGSVIIGRGRSVAGSEAFRWTGATGMVGLGDLPGGTFYSSASGVSADGNVIVGYSHSAANDPEAFRWTASNGMVGLGDLPGGRATSFAFAVSDDGSVVVGASGSANATGGSWEAFRWTAGGGMMPLGDFLSGPTNSVAYGISPDGLVIIGRGHTGVEDPFRWTADAGLAHLGFLPCYDWNTAFATSADGSIIVGDPNQPAGNCSFIWDAQHGIRNLYIVLTNDYGLNLTGWQLTHARGITPDGKIIVGDGWNPAGQREAWIANLRPPSLALHLEGTHAVLSWETNAVRFALQQTSSLVDSNGWTNVLGSPVVVSNRYTVSNGVTEAQSFYRLKKF